MDPGHEAISLVDYDHDDDEEHRPSSEHRSSRAAATSHALAFAAAHSNPHHPSTATLIELERLRPTLPPETYNRLRQSAMRYDAHTPPAPGTPTLRAGPLPIPSPAMGLRSPLSPRRPSLAERRSENAFVLRRGEEDAQTTLGRRVTARESDPSPDDRSHLPALRVLRTLSRTPDTRLARLETDAAASAEGRRRAPPLPTFNELYMRSRAIQANEAEYPSSASTGRQSAPQSRLSTLSALGSTQNMASPATPTLPPRPVLFTEPEAMTEGESVSAPERRAADVRASYLWDLATPQARPPRQVARTVRYDADGNELREPAREPPVTRAPITPDSAHGDPRVRLGGRAPERESLDTWLYVDDDEQAPATRAGASERIWPIRPEWQSWREWRDSAEAHAARLEAQTARPETQTARSEAQTARSEAQAARTASRAARKAPEAGPGASEEPIYYGSSVPFEPDPLPMPLDEMVVYPASRRTPALSRVVDQARVVDRRASVAGR